MRNLYKTKIGHPLAFLRTAGKSNKLIGYDSYRRNAELFNVALVNYQP